MGSWFRPLPHLLIGPDSAHFKKIGIPPFVTAHMFCASWDGPRSSVFLRIVLLKQSYSRLPITRTLANSNLALTRTNFPFLSGHFLYNFTLDNSNLFQFPLKVRVNRRESTVFCAVCDYTGKADLKAVKKKKKNNNNKDLKARVSTHFREIIKLSI